ncbi:MAG TPA: 50S ribosomal protein L4, partial [Gemmatimonadales bacterium]|nr:50S ribosomal protein L4 [Gemmatimonadales bacterium]
VLVLTATHRPAVWLSGRNLPKVDVLQYAEASAYDILWADQVVVEEAALTGGEAVANPAAPAAPAAEGKAPKARKAPAKKAKAEKKAAKPKAEKKAPKAKAAAKKPAKKAAPKKKGGK